MYTKRSPLTFDQYSDQIAYDKETGVFTWKKARSRRYKAGMQIGNVKSRRDRYGVMREYLYIGLFGQQVPAQRVAWLLHYGEWPKGNVLFKDGDTMNIRIENLKEGEYPPIQIKEEGKKTRYKMPAEQQRKFGLKRYYGLSLETYNVMLAAQGGVCAICKKTETYQPKTYSGPKALSVDHNHETGEIRGLLCSRCNYMIGHCLEDEQILLAGVEYLRKYAKRVPFGSDAPIVPDAPPGVLN